MPHPIFVKNLLQMTNDAFLVQFPFFNCENATVVKTCPKLEPVFLLFHINMEKA
jgi:hypothetical protein